MEAAIFGLLGIVVGAVLNGLQNYSLVRRKERREVRTAARLLLIELEELEHSLRLALVNPNRATVARLDEMKWWNDHHVDLADSLDNEWSALQVLNESVRLLKHEAEEVEERDEPLTETDLAHLRLTHDVTQDAIALLRRAAGLSTSRAQDRKGSQTYEKYLAAGGQPIKRRVLRR